MSTIKELLEAVNPSASKMTHLLSDIGDGDMHKGIVKLCDTRESDGIKRGRIQGGATVCAFFTGAAVIYKVAPILKKKIKEAKEHRAEKERIKNTIKMHISSDSENGDNHTD